MKYLIALRDGVYEAKFESSMRSTMLAEELAGRVGAQVLYRGNIGDAREAAAVLDAVQEANESGKFDPALLEKKLLESASKF